MAPFFAGSQVYLFFVLSGFVLSLPHWRGRSQLYGTYLVRRFVRIYIPFAVAVLLSLIGAWLFRGYHLPLTHFFRSMWSAPITPGLVTRQLLLWPDSSLNFAFWSLRYEVQLSLAMPLIVCLLRRQPAAVLTVSLLLGFGSMGLITRLNQFHYVGDTLRIGSLFMLGATVAMHEVILIAWVRRAGAHAWLLFAASLSLYLGYPSLLPLGAVQAWLTDRHALMAALGSAGLLLCALALAPVATALGGGKLAYLGRLSYSVYLVHGTVIVALFDLFYGRLRGPVLYPVVVLTCWLAAHVFSITVAEPCIRLSQRATVRSKLASRSVNHTMLATIQTDHTVA